MNSYFNTNWILAALCCGGFVWPVAADEAVSFRREVAPILLEHCVACHNAKQAEGGYRLDTFAELIKAGDSGVDPIAAQEEDQAELLERLTTDDEFERMPAESPALDEAEIRLIADWVQANNWVDFLAEREPERSSTSVCLRITDPWFATKPEGEQRALVKKLVGLLADQSVAYDINAYRDAPPGYRHAAGLVP